MSYQPHQSEDATLKPVAGSAPTGDAWIAEQRAAFEAWFRAEYESRLYCESRWDGWLAHARLRSQGGAGLPATDEQRCQDYLAGWNNSAIWAGREDLLSDVDSAAYIKERDVLLASLHLPQDKKE